MSKYIDADDLMYKLENVYDDEMSEFNQEYAHGIEIAQHILEEMPAADVEPVRKWIPCSEQMPEEPYGCLVFVEATDRYTGEDYTTLLPRFAGYDGERWNDDDGQEVPFEVLAWRKLPEPPKMDGGSE
ncbi:MAG: DUF551 domain-containing protein [Lachnospiraceae bacterium]|nr:DUF551 domain-containing protein [Lachnospiraceae bacterium]